MFFCFENARERASFAFSRDTGKACVGRKVSAREAEEFERRMEAFPEADCDDSYLLDYYAMSVMGIPFEALHVLAGGGVERALACSELALELLGGFRDELDDENELWEV